ncbi:MAG: hypothetical protein GEV28_11845 [Actinophytocola sp.]|uniref:terminase TerL endonuclease subunit n=1 Tax=Actinophytocola sp. TaxID=1872138 RepID=UPI00132A1ECE|nr:terminase TerL endonuclease subunit [Actinophytocola sp.]MPZ81041.1 hypothetical protein [Actinophytocola sp.]
MLTDMGTRAQPLMVAATTAGDDPASFARSEHDECARIIDDPQRAAHRFAYIRNVPEDADPWDEKLWPLDNPALGEFLLIKSLRQEAIEAQNDPSKENAFRQYRLNQWVAQSHRWMPMHLYRHRHRRPCPGLAARRAGRPPRLQRTRRGHGVDAVAVLAPAGRRGLPRPAHERRGLAAADGGWITVTPGDVIDYDTIYADIAEDCATYPRHGRRLRRVVRRTGPPGHPEADPARPRAHPAEPTAA